jgi:hypothetical protein
MSPSYFVHETQNLKLLHCFLIDETLTKSIKQNTSQRGKRGNKEIGPKSKLEKQNSKWVIMRQKNKSCSKAATSCKKDINKRKGWEI